jgi:hypothetical protein
LGLRFRLYISNVFAARRLVLVTMNASLPQAKRVDRHRSFGIGSGERTLQGFGGV